MLIPMRNSRSLYRKLSPLACLLLWPVASGFCAPAPASKSLAAELLKTLDQHQLQAGTTFFLKTVTTWQDGACTVRPGATLEGVVTEIKRRKDGGKLAQLSLRFLPLSCSGDETEMLVPLLVALKSATPEPTSEALQQDAMVTAMSAMVGRAPMGAPRSGRSQGNVNQLQDPRAIEEALRVPGAVSTLKVGEVAGIHGVKIVLPSYINDPTLLISSRDFSLERGTQLAFILRPSAPEQPGSVARKDNSPAPAASPSATASASGSAPTVPPLPAALPEPETDVCAGTGCALAADASSITATEAETVVPLAQLGFRMRNRRTVKALDEDGAVAFLGDRQLLVTFATHALVSRTDAEASTGADPRIIRAVLLSVPSGRVLKIVDWRVSDARAHLWALDGSRVLAHVGNALVVYGPGLAMLREYKLPGPLIFVSVSPDRKLFSVATVRERHTPAMHQKLALFMGPDQPPEEDYDLTVLTEVFETVGTTTLYSQPPRPALLNSGTVIAAHGAAQRWAIQEQTWKQGSRTIAHVTSPCDLSILTLPGDLLFVTGCVADRGATWYRILRSDGATLLKAVAPINELVQYAAGTSGDTFAVGVSTAINPIDMPQGMPLSELTSLAVAVYRSSDGKRLFATRTPTAATNRQSFALSPSGDRLAILSGEQVRLYATGAAQTSSTH